MKKIMPLYFFILMWITLNTFAQTDTGIITPQNATQLTQVHQIGDGIAQKIAYSPTGDTFAVLSSLGAWVYDVNNPATAPFLLDGHTTRANILAYSPDGQFLVTAGYDFILQVWHIPSQKLATTIETPFFNPQRIMFRPDGQLLVMHDGFRVQFVSLTDEQVIYEHRLGGEAFFTMDYHPRGTQFITTVRGDSPTITVYTISDPQLGLNTTITETMTLPMPTNEARFWLVDYSADGTQIIGVGGDGTVALWDSQTGELLRSYEAHPIDEFAPWHLDSADNGFISATERGFVKAWSNSGDLVAQTTIENVIGVSFAPNGQSAWIIAQPNPPFTTIHRWDIATNTLIETHIPQQWVRVADIDVSSDGNILAIASLANMVLVNTTTWEDIATYESDIKSVAFHPTIPTIIASLSADAVGILNLEIDSFTALSAPDSTERDLTFSPDGNTIATRFWQEAIVRHIDDPTMPNVVIGGQLAGDISTITYSPDSTLIFVTYFGDNRIEFWRSQTGELIHIMDYAHSLGIFDIAFHPNGDYFASTSDDGTLQVHHITTYEAVVNIALVEAGMEKLNQLAYSPDGRLLVGGGFDGKIFILDAQTGALLHHFFAHRATITHLIFSPDGSRLYSASTDGTIRVWAISE